MLAHTPDGLPLESKAEHGFLLATAGLAHVPPDDLSELRRLMERVYSPLEPNDRAWMPTYMDRLRRGELGPAEASRGRALLTTGIVRLSEADRDRLQAIFERAITRGIEQRRQAESRTATYQEITPASPPPSRSAVAHAASPSQAAGAAAATASFDRSDSRGESYWRGRMDAARERVRKAEQELAEAESKEISFVTPGTTDCAGSIGMRVRTEKERQECVAWQTQGNKADLDRARASSARVRQARAQLEASRKSLEALEDEARRGGALPGWTR